MVALSVAVLVGTHAVAAADIGRAKFVKRADNICQPERSDAKRLITNGVRLLTNNPDKGEALARHGIAVGERVRLPVDATPANLAYLRTKRDRMGHDLPDLPAAPGASAVPAAVSTAPAAPAASAPARRGA